MVSERRATMANEAGAAMAKGTWELGNSGPDAAHVEVGRGTKEREDRG